MHIVSNVHKITLLLKTRKLGADGCCARAIISTFIFAALLLWLFCIYQALPLIRQGIWNSKIISVVPIAFFGSLSLLSISFLATLKIRTRSQIVLFCQVIMLIFFLNFTPPIIEGTARFSTTYFHYQSVDHISKNGYINPTVQWTHNWPSFSIVCSALMQIVALPEQILLGVYSTFFNVALFFALFIFFRLVVENMKSRWIGIWTFYIANWVGQDYFSMQSLGFFTFVLMLFVLFKLINTQKRTRQWYISLILFFSFLSTSHMLSSLVVLAVIFVFYTSKNLWRPVFAAVFFLLFITWNIYGAATYFEWKFPRFMVEALNFELIFQTNVPARVAGSVSRIIVTQIRLIFSVLIATFAFCGLAIAWGRRKIENTDKRILFLLIGVSLPLGLFVYGGELFMRLFFFSLIPLSYFISKGSSWKIYFWLFAIFLIIVAPPLHIIAHYGNEVMDYVPPSEIKGVAFFHNKTTQGYVVGGYKVIGNFRDYKYRESHEYISLTRTEWKNNALSLEWIEDARLDWPRFVCISYGMKEYYNFFLGEPQLIIEVSKNLTESTRYNKFYSNPSFEVYLESRL